MVEKRFNMPLKCTNKDCSVHSSCLLLRTEVIGDKKRIRKEGLDVLLIGEAGGAEESIKRRCFVGESGHLLRKTIGMVNDVPKRTYGLTNIFRHRPVDEFGQNRAPTLQEYNWCKGNLRKDIQRLKPKVIVTLGNVPYKYLTGSPPPSYKDFGLPFKTEILGHECWLYPAYHPARVLRQVGTITDFVNQLRRAFGYCDKYPHIDHRKLKHHLIRKPSEIERLLTSFVKSNRPVAFDTEAINVNRVYDNRCLSIQLSNDGINSYVIPIDHVKIGLRGTDRDRVVKMLREFFGRKSNIDGVIAHNAVFDMHMIRNTLLGLRVVPHIVLDTMIQAYLLEENYAGNPSRYGLKPVAYSYGYDYEKHHSSALYARTRGQLEMLPTDEFVNYGGADACVTWQIYKIQREAAYLQKDYGDKCDTLLRYFYSNLVLFYTEMESNGLPVSKQHIIELVDKDKSVVKQHKQKLVEKLMKLPEVQKTNKLLLKDSTGLTKGIWGTPNVFNMSTPKHRQKLFFEVLGYEPLSVGKSGEGSVDSNFLKSIKDECPAADILLKYAQVEKLDNSFIEPIYKKLINESDAKDLHIRSSFGAVTTLTGRASSLNPNCLAYNTYVATRTYGSVLIGDIVKAELKGTELSSFGLHGKITDIMTKVLNKYAIIRTECGRQIEAGLKHRLFSRKGSKNTPKHNFAWRRVSHIKVGDFLLLELGFQYGVKKKKQNNVFDEFPVALNKNVCTYLGLLLSSATVNPETNQIEFTNAEMEDYAKSLLQDAYDAVLKRTPTKYVYDIPFFLMTLDAELVSAYLRGFLQGRNPVKWMWVELRKTIKAYVVRKLMYAFQSVGVYTVAKFADPNRGLVVVEIKNRPCVIQTRVSSVYFKTKKPGEKGFTFYDIEVSPNHLYTANGFISHNSQNFPKIRGDDFAKEVRYATRRMFEAPIDWGFLELDYKTNEVRGWGIISGDKTLAENFKKADEILAKYRHNPTPELKKLLKASDPHTLNAASAFGKHPLEVSKDERQATKKLTFGMIYGMMLKTIAKDLGIPMEEAEQIARRFFDSVPDAEKWLYDIEKFAALNYYVESPLGRRRRLYYYLLPWTINPQRYGGFKAEHDRRARNAPIQGMSSDFAFLGAFIFFIEYIVKKNKRWKICNVIHDSTVVLAPVNELREVALACEWYYTKGVEIYIKEKFGFQLPFSLAIDIGMGLNLAEMESWDFTDAELQRIHRDLQRKNRLRKRAANFEYEEYDWNPKGVVTLDAPQLLPPAELPV